MDPKIEGLLARIGNDDPRYEAIKQQEHTAICWGFKYSDNQKPMCTAALAGGVMATVMAEPNKPENDWFKRLVDDHDGDESFSTSLTFKIENASNKRIYDGMGVIAVPVQTQLEVIVDEIKQDQVKLWIEKPENAGKGDQRPRGQKDEDLMTILRIAAKRNGYVDETPSQSYSKFTNDVLWAAVEQGLPFRVRHAIMNSKGGDAHYTND
tara:strand:+ start:77 stop:703 length:627 start_codon:yes stop_codon:yes gene_type:complete